MMFHALGVVRVLAEPELKTVTTFDGKEVELCRIFCAVDTPGNSEKDDAYNFFEWDASGAAAARVLTPGQQVMFSGRPKTERWRDRETGDPRTRVIFVGHFHFLDRKGVERPEDLDAHLCRELPPAGWRPGESDSALDA